MSANRTSALKCPETNPRQCTLDFAEDSHAEQGLAVEQDLESRKMFCGPWLSAHFYMS